MFDDIVAELATRIAQFDGRIEAGEAPPHPATITPPDPSTGMQGPTAHELCLKANEYIRAARSLVGTGHVDAAADIIGYAAEFALKARYLVRQGWANWPHPGEAEHRGVPSRLMTHDLDRLLQLADSQGIRTSELIHIDWTRASEWRVQHRYRPLGATTPDQVRLQIDETERLCRALALHTAAERLRVAELEMSTALGPFNFFGILAPDPGADSWEVWFAGWWAIRREDPRTAVADVREHCRAALVDNDLDALFTATRGISPAHDVAWGYYRLLNGCAHQLVQVWENVDGYAGVLPRGFVITSVRPQRQDDDLEGPGKEGPTVEPDTCGGDARVTART